MTQYVPRGSSGGVTDVVKTRQYDMPASVENRMEAIQRVNEITQAQSRRHAAQCDPQGSGGFWEGLWENLRPGQIVPYLWHEAVTNPYLNQKISPQEGLKFALMGAVVIGATLLTGGAAAVPILVGAGIGAGIGYGAQVYQNLQQGMDLNKALATNINPLGIMQGAMHGAFSGAVAAVVEPLLPVGGVGLTRALMTGMTEFVSGRATQVALNLVSGERWDTNLWNPQDPQWQLDVLLDVVPGVGAGLLGEAWQAARAARYADLPSVSGLDDAVRYIDDVPAARRLDDAVDGAQTRVNAADTDAKIKARVLENLAESKAAREGSGFRDWSQQVETKANVRNNLAEFKEGTRASRFRDWSRRVEAEAAWRELGRKHGAKVDVTQDPNVRRLIEKGIGPSGDLLPKPRYMNVSPELVGVYEIARRLNIPDRVTNTILNTLQPGRSISIELKKIGDKLAMKPAAKYFDELLPYKPTDLSHLHSDEFGFVVDPESGRIFLSDPDLSVVIEDGHILSEVGGLKLAQKMNRLAKGKGLPGIDPFQHSHMATLYQKKAVLDDPNLLAKATSPPDGAVAFDLDAQGRPMARVLRGEDAYLDWVEEVAYNTDLAQYPWAVRSFEGRDPWGPNRALDNPPGDMITPQNAPPNTMVTLTPSGGGDINTLPPNATLLWTINEHGAHFVVEETQWPSSGRGIPSHTNLSREAFAGGEALVVGPNKIIINAGSRAYGYNWRDATVNIEAAARYNAAKYYLRGLGLEVEVIPVNLREMKK
jgi:hypothetical protein